MVVYRFETQTQRLYVMNQRIHHGPLGLSSGLLVACDRRVPWLERLGLSGLLILWGLSDLHDWRVWFRPGLQLELDDLMHITSDNAKSSKPHARTLTQSFKRWTQSRRRTEDRQVT